MRKRHIIRRQQPFNGRRKLAAGKVFGTFNEPRVYFLRRHAAHEVRRCDLIPRKRAGCQDPCRLPEMSALLFHVTIPAKKKKISTASQATLKGPVRGRIELLLLHSDLNQTAASIPFFLRPTPPPPLSLTHTLAPTHTHTRGPRGERWSHWLTTIMC